MKFKYLIYIFLSSSVFSRSVYRADRAHMMVAWVRCTLAVARTWDLSLSRWGLSWAGETRELTCAVYRCTGLYRQSHTDTDQVNMETPGAVRSVTSVPSWAVTSVTRWQSRSESEHPPDSRWLTPGPVSARVTRWCIRPAYSISSSLMWCGLIWEVQGCVQHGHGPPHALIHPWNK